jgi:hypothetical protein
MLRKRFGELLRPDLEAVVLPYHMTRMAFQRKYIKVL